MAILFYYISEVTAQYKCETFFLKNVQKNNKAVHLRLVLTYLFKILFNTKKHLAWALKKIVHLFFCVFQTKLKKAVNIFCTLP